MPTRRQLIQKITLNANASSVTFSNIPQNYTDLKIVSSTRSSFASTAISVKLRFNGSASDTNHSCRRLYGSGSSAASDTQAFSLLGVMGGSTSTSNTFSIHEAYIPNYTSSNNKTIQSKSATEENATTAYILQIANLFSSTSPITSIEVLDASGNFVANSTFYLYGITQVPIIRGGTVTVPGDGFKYHTFTSSGSLQVIEPGDVEYLVVAGGGGGGYDAGGGGGGGGLLNSKFRINPGIYTATIGAGGSSGGSGQGLSGSNSSINDITSTGGGGGGAYSNDANARIGANGGSGGGGGSIASGGGSASGGSGISGQGNSGGTGNHTSGSGAAGGGGGGAGSAGSNYSGVTGGAGGNGKLVFGSYYAGGGGGFSNSTTQAAGGLGGGGLGTYTPSARVDGTNGQSNTGGGGGGAGTASRSAGGSGIVIIRYPYDGN